MQYLLLEKLRGYDFMYKYVVLLLNTMSAFLYELLRSSLS